jgi:hypothetical protein
MNQAPGRAGGHWALGRGLLGLGPAKFVRNSPVWWNLFINMARWHLAGVASRSWESLNLESRYWCALQPAEPCVHLYLVCRQAGRLPEPRGCCYPEVFAGKGYGDAEHSMVACSVDCSVMDVNTRCVWLHAWSVGIKLEIAMQRTRTLAQSPCCPVRFEPLDACCHGNKLQVSRAVKSWELC